MASTANPLERDLTEILQAAPSMWEQLRGARIFLTGGTGFIGSWMLESLLWADMQLDLGAHATVLSRNPASFARRSPHLAGDSRVTMIEGDLASFDFPAREHTHILHMATETNTAMQNPAPSVYFDTAVDGTRRVLDFARATGARRLLFTSSGAVYGPQPAECEGLSEDMNIAPPTENVAAAYGHGKRAAEFLCCAAHAESGLEATIARCFAFVGPYLPLDSGFAIGNFIRDALAGKTIAVASDGSAVRSYLYAADMALWLWTILTMGQPARPYNVGSDQAIDIGNLAQTVAHALQSCAGVSIAGHRDPNALRHRYVPDVSRAAEELGLRPRINLDDAIHRTAEWNLAKTSKEQSPDDRR